MSVIIPVVRLEVYSQMSLVELVRGAISSTQQQNTAAILQTIIGSLDRVLCPMYARRHKPDADVLPLDRRQHGEEESDEVKQESQSFQLSLHSNGKFKNFEQIQFRQIENECL